MGLKDKKDLFSKNRDKWEICVTNHAYIDYPKRGFSSQEILRLIKNCTKWKITDNKSSDAIEESVLYFVKDSLDRKCKLVLLIEEENKKIRCCSAYREV
ncbi:MAG: hypothetical protein HAW60_03795 [Bdellovibrionales bacterium]|nr:hypothetical protein [Bdellovibrionales bacterium]